MTVFWCHQVALTGSLIIPTTFSFSPNSFLTSSSLPGGEIKCRQSFRDSFFIYRAISFFAALLPVFLQYGDLGIYFRLRPTSLQQLFTGPSVIKEIKYRCGCGFLLHAHAGVGESVYSCNTNKWQCKSKLYFTYSQLRTYSTYSNSCELAHVCNWTCFVTLCVVST